MNCIYLTDTMNAPDIYVSGLGEVEDLGDGCFRFTFFTKHHSGGGEELVVSAKLIVHKSAVAPALLMAAKAVGFPTTVISAFAPQKGMH